MRKRMFGVLAGLSLVVVAAACGDDDDSSASADTAAARDHGDSGDDGAGDDAAAAPTTAASKIAVPSKIISLSPTATEMLYAVGAGDQVLAVDDFSNYPEEAAAKMQGLSGFEPNVEAIAGLEPDLVVTDGTQSRPAVPVRHARDRSLGRAGGGDVRRHLHPDRAARRDHRSRRRSRRARRPDADRHRHRGRRPARSTRSR